MSTSSFKNGHQKYVFYYTQYCFLDCRMLCFMFSLVGIAFVVVRACRAVACIRSTNKKSATAIHVPYIHHMHACTVEIKGH